ncbi:MAG: PIN domain-containing protein [Deltaproteobacteria bacterium]|nr:PIN domain-containing protein [Deltaproteobacteria bacterium]
MAINYTIQADIVDITSDTPKAEDVFLVDTNVWYWITYTRASQSTRPPLAYQTTSYPAYYNSALAADSKILQSGLSLAELAHLIEKTEYEIFAGANLTYFRDPNRFDKRYRHSFPVERSRVVAEIKAAWRLVKEHAALPITIDAQATEATLNRLQTEKVDGYDLFILESMKSHGLSQVITDDGDFASVPDIQVFTANQNVITTARSQGKLLTR